jgi:hypothetical protein
MLHSLIVSVGVPFLILSGKQVETSYFDTGISKTTSSVSGFLLDTGYVLFPELIAGASYELSLSPSFKTVISQGLQIYSKYYFLGGASSYKEYSTESKVQAGFNTSAQFTSEIEPIWSAYFQAGMQIKGFKFPETKQNNGRILLSDSSSSFQNSGTFFGISATLGGETLIQPHMRLGVRGFYTQAIGGVERISLSEVGGALTYSLQFYK